MSRFLAMITMMIMVVMYPIFAFAEEASTPPDFAQFWEAIQNGNWPLGVALGLMILMWILRNFVKDKIPKKYLPYLTFAIGVIGMVGTRMLEFINTNRPWWQGLIQGAIEGAGAAWAAMGMHSTGGKKLPVRGESKEE